VGEGGGAVVCVKVNKAVKEVGRNWKNELKSLQELRHRNIVEIVLSGEEPTTDPMTGEPLVQPVLVMEWLSGGSLESARDAVRAAGQVWSVLVQVCGALA